MRLRTGQFSTTTSLPLPVERPERLACGSAVFTDTTSKTRGFPGCWGHAPAAAKIQAKQRAGLVIWLFDAQTRSSFRPDDWFVSHIDVAPSGPLECGLLKRNRGAGMRASRIIVLLWIGIGLVSCERREHS